jgi:putative FmdB family regulatory protein
MNYTYFCKEHGMFTLTRSIKDEPLKVCPDCGKTVTQQFTNSSSAIVHCGGFFGKSK